jgi:hypothetical protein
MKGRVRMKAQFSPLPRHRKRSYRFEINLPPFDDDAWDVVHSIEQTEIRVVEPGNWNALGEVHDKDGAILVDSDATMVVPLQEWLAVGCQRVRWSEEEGDDSFDEGVCGLYRANWPAVFGPPYAEALPHGPSVFMGEIVLPRNIQRAWLRYSEDKRKSTGIVSAVQLIIAHELVHVFDGLKYLVPAFLNWPAFWRNVLGQGSANDLLYSRMSCRTCFIDDYGNPNELAMLSNWWSSQRAEAWFEARKWLPLLVRGSRKRAIIRKSQRLAEASITGEPGAVP